MHTILQISSYLSIYSYNSTPLRSTAVLLQIKHRRIWDMAVFSPLHLRPRRDSNTLFVIWADIGRAFLLNLQKLLDQTYKSF